MKHLESFEAAAEFVGLNPQALPVITGIPEREANALLALYKLSVLSEASWKIDGKEIDWDNDDQYKYYGWFDMEASSGSGSGFSCLGCYYADSNSAVGSRLVFPSSEIARYVATTHLELYRAFLVKE